MGLCYLLFYSLLATKTNTANANANANAHVGMVIGRSAGSF